ncbi:unnamed protein product [Sphenostylis stenocarpa]|uniref:Oberon PHD finger domain-containing protein n=1 Tax=Sphenostylis stenocarpa TaxID=92480 RepID=A0AA86S5Z3_9FABA|nr:unnamed protein product [Sphenostylis stenocarpa]
MSGDGHPYAPENWPEQGDVWGWRTGRRIVPNGTHFQNRYLYLPYRLRMLMEEKENKGSGSSTSRKQHVFASKLAVKRYVKRYFPDADLNAFFASFSWNIPAHPSLSAPIAAIPLRQIAPQAQQAEEACNSDSGDDVKCKANNRKCPTIVLEEEEVQKYSPVMPCPYGGFSYFKCPVNANGGICGHVAHMECALECFVAGKVRSLGLDAEYYCRRCDGRSDMISHVYNLIQTCKTIDLDYEIKKILYIGASLIRGSERPLANKLLRSIDLAVSKANDQFDDLLQLISGTNPADIWKILKILVHEQNTLVSQMSSAASEVLYSAIIERKKQIRRELEIFDTMKKVAIDDNVNVMQDTVSDDHFEVKTGAQELEYKMVEEALEAKKKTICQCFLAKKSEMIKDVKEVSSFHDAHFCKVFLGFAYLIDKTPLMYLKLADGCVHERLEIGGDFVPGVLEVNLIDKVVKFSSAYGYPPYTSSGTGTVNQEYLYTASQYAHWITKLLRYEL